MNSVCMASYNGAKYIQAQISSILIQLGPEDELVISDDSSTDLTVSIIKNIMDPRIRLTENNLFRDPIKNFQNALEHSRGELIFLSDQDDIWIEGKYAEMAELLQTYDLVISDSMIVDEELKVIHTSFFRYFNSGKGILKNIMKSSYYGSCMAFTRRIMLEALPFPDTREIGHDLWLGLIAELSGTVLFYEKPLLLYRRHTNAFTPLTVGKSKRNIYQMITGRFIMFRELLKYFYKNSTHGKRTRFNNNTSL